MHKEKWIKEVLGKKLSLVIENNKSKKFNIL